MPKLMILLVALGFCSACTKESDIASSTSELAASTTNRSAQTTRVFKANFYSSVDANPAIPPTACSGDLPGFANPGYFIHGKATHMGILTSPLSRGQDVTCNLSFATMLLTTTVAGQLAAANGDLIYYTGVDAIDASKFLTGTGTTGTITGTWTITGGTGRFAGATGSFDINGPVDFVTGTFSYEAIGTISY